MEKIFESRHFLAIKRPYLDLATGPIGLVARSSRKTQWRVGGPDYQLESRVDREALEADMRFPWDALRRR